MALKLDNSKFIDINSGKGLNSRQFLVVEDDLKDGAGTAYSPFSSAVWGGALDQGGIIYQCTLINIHAYFTGVYAVNSGGTRAASVTNPGALPLRLAIGVTQAGESTPTVILPRSVRSPVPTGRGDYTVDIPSASAASINTTESSLLDFDIPNGTTNLWVKVGYTGALGGNSVKYGDLVISFDIARYKGKRGDITLG